MSLKVLKRIQMLTVSEDGTLGRSAQTIYIDSTAPVEFVIRVPLYVAAALGCAIEVRHATAAGVVPIFDKLMRDYLDWIRTAKAEPVILLETKLLSLDRTGSGRHDVDHEAFFFRDNLGDYEHDVTVGLKYRLLFRVNGALFFRKSDTDKEGEFRPGHRLGHSDGVVLDYTPELHARLDRICGALHDAAHTLHEIIKSKDVGAALLASTSLRLTGTSP